MRTLLVGKWSKANSIDSLFRMAGREVPYVADAETAIRFLQAHACDVVLIVSGECLEEIGLVAEKIKHAVSVGASVSQPYVFALYDGSLCGFVRGNEYGLIEVDIVLEDFSIDMVEQAYQYIQRDAAL